MTFYAKSDQTYEEHLEAVYLAWKETINAKKSLIDRLAKRYDFSVERFIQGSLLTIAFHDIGKMIEPFQEMMLAIRQKKPFDKKINYRHELVSFVFTAKYWHALNKDKLSYLPLEALAVVSHHKILDSDLTSFNREGVASLPKVIPEGLKEAIQTAKELFEREGLIFPSVEISRCEDPYKSLAGLVSTGVLSKGIEKDGAEKVRVLYFLLKGILHYADWHGSGKVSVNYRINKDPSPIIAELAKRCETKQISYKGLKPFQETCSHHSGHLILVAPTGSGKTEASILWALKNAKEMGGAKIIYLLPTMVTANSIWKRMVDFFGEENVGLTHSTANLFLQNDSIEEEEDRWEDRNGILFNQSFIKPVTVATVDQLLTAGFNSGRWTLKEINTSNAVVIIDEIHSYDGWTSGLIISTIRHFASLGTRFMLMSATMPDSLQQLFLKELFSAMVIKEETLLSAKRSKYFAKDVLIEDGLEDIKKAVLKGRKILVVVNTVNLCQRLAQELSELKPICYHSQFILKDRKAIEEKIGNARFVIATQVVEVSLDINYDWLFTECAPPDAMVQRAGRVNRYRNPQKDSRVYIFKASEKGEKIYNPINDLELLSRSFEAFKKLPSEPTEENLIELVEKVYENYRIEVSESFKDAIGQYRLSQSNRSMLFDSRLKEDKQEVTRYIKYETVSVIPQCFKEEVLKLKSTERRWYEIKLPWWYVRKNKDEMKGISFCDVNYDSKIGATFIKNNEILNIIF